MPEIVIRFERVRWGSSSLSRETCERAGVVCGVTRLPSSFTSNGHPLALGSPRTLPTLGSDLRSTLNLIVDINLFADQVRRLVLRLVVRSHDHLSQKTHKHKLNPHREHDHRESRKRHAIEVYSLDDSIVERER